MIKNGIYNEEEKTNSIIDELNFICDIHGSPI